METNSNASSYGMHTDVYEPHFTKENESNIDDQINFRDRIELAKLLLTQAHSIVGISLSTLAIILNMASLFALSYVRGRTAAHFQLVKSLACSDIVTGLTVIMHELNRAFNPVLGLFIGTINERQLSFCMHMIIKANFSASLNINLFNLLLMAFDHYLAILKPLHHDRILSKKRTRIVIIIFWILAFVIGFSDFYAEVNIISKIKKEFQSTFCEAVYITRYQCEYAVFAVLCIIYPTLILLYTRMCIHIRTLTSPGQHDQIGSESEQHFRQQKIDKRNRKAVGTTLLILGTFSVCWLPNFLFQTITSIYAEINHPITLSKPVLNLLRYFDKTFLILLLINCCLDPLIYSFRLREIRLGYWRALRCGRIETDSHTTYSGVSSVPLMHNPQRPRAPSGSNHDGKQ